MSLHDFILNLLLMGSETQILNMLGKFPDISVKFQDQLTKD